MAFYFNGAAWEQVADGFVVSDIIEVTNPSQLKEYTNENITALFPNADPEKDKLRLREFGDRVYILLTCTKEDPEGLPAGIYHVQAQPWETVFYPVNLSLDKYIPLNDDFETIKRDVLNFFSPDIRDRYKGLGMVHKRGTFVYGTPGNGKTRTALEAASHAVELGARVLLVDANLFYDIAHMSENLKGVPKVVIMEEITPDTELLKFLDGENSWDNTYFICTTNNPEDLDEEYFSKLLDRPGRIDTVIRIDEPTQAQRRAYAANFVDGDVLDQVVKLTRDFSLAYLKGVITEHLIYERPVDEIVAQFTQRRKDAKNGFKPRKSDGEVFKL